MQLLMIMTGGSVVNVFFLNNIYYFLIFLHNVVTCHFPPTSQMSSII